MIAEAGLAALWLAAAFALIQLALAAGGARARSAEMMLAARRIAVVQGALAAVSFGLLILLFVIAVAINTLLNRYGEKSYVTR